MPIWTMSPDGRRARVVLAHRAQAAALTDNAVLTEEQSERVSAALREIDANTGRTIHFGRRDGPDCGTEPVGAYWTDEPESVRDCSDCLNLTG